MKEHYKINEAVSDLREPPESYPKETKRLIPAMKAYLRGRDLSYTTAVENGWYPTEKVRERDPVVRIVIPATNEHGRPYWQARAMLPHNLRYRSAKGGRFGSIIVVWPYHEPLQMKGTWEPSMVLCEGPMDALAAAGLGYFSIATMGALFSSYAVKYIQKYVNKKTPVIVIPDLDLPDFGAENVAALAKVGRRVVMHLPVGGKDLAKMKPKAREALLHG
jgi:hypothetical protein